MPDDGSTGSGGVSPDVSILSGDEEGEDEESVHGDDEGEMDEINHEKLPKAVVRAHSPGRRAHTSPPWTHLRHIDKNDVSGHEMNAECTHVGVYPLSDGEGGVKRY